MGSKSAELEHIEKGHDPHSNDHTSNPLNQQDRDANIGKEDWRATALAWLRMVQENVALLVGDADQNMNATWKSFLRPWLFYLFPIAEQLHPKRYSWGFLLADILAALSVTAMIIPQSLAYGSLAGVPPMQCFVSASFPLLVYAFLGSGRQLALGPEALTSVLVGVYASKEVASNGGTVGDIAGALAVMVAIGCFILAVLQAGFVDNILAGFLLTGFVCGIATLVMVEQLPGLLGIVIHHDPNASAAEFFWEVILNMGDTHLNTAMIALTNVTFLMVAKKLKKKYGPKLKTSPWGKYLLLIPELFILVVIMISIGFSRDLGGKGVKMLGEIKVQLQFKPIQLSSEVFMRLIQPAVIITVMAFVVSQVVNRTFGMENNYTVSKHRELVALGAANLVSAAAGGYVVCGSLPRSRILATAGGRSMLCNLLVGIFTLCGVMSLASTFAYLPKATLSAAVFVAAYGLIDWTEIGFLFRLRSYWEIAQFLVTYVITIGSSISYGVIFCLMLAALVIVRRTTRLEMGIMGRLTLYTISDKDRTEARDKQLLGKSPFGDEQATSSNIRESNSVSSSDTTRASLIPPGVQFRFVNIEEYPDAELFDDIVIISFKGPLLFFNANRVPREISFMMLKDKKIRIYRQREHKRREMAKGEPSKNEEDTYVAVTLDTLEVVTSAPKKPHGSLSSLNFLADVGSHSRVTSSVLPTSGQIDKTKDHSESPKVNSPGTDIIKEEDEDEDEIEENERDDHDFRDTAPINSQKYKSSFAGDFKDAWKRYWKQGSKDDTEGSARRRHGGSRKSTKADGPTLKAVIFDFQSCDDMDSAAAYIFVSSIKNIKGRVLLVNLRENHARILVRSGILVGEGPDQNVYFTLGQAVRAVVGDAEYFRMNK